MTIEQFNELLEQKKADKHLLINSFDAIATIMDLMMETNAEGYTLEMGNKVLKFELKDKETKND
jgi:urease gamma subunit